LYYLARIRGYSLVACDKRGVNAFFVRDDLLKDGRLIAQTPADAYKPPRFGKEVDEGVFIGHEPTPREFVEVNRNVDLP